MNLSFYFVRLSELSLVTKLVKKGANVKCQDLTSKDGPLHFIASSSCGKTLSKCFVSLSNQDDRRCRYFLDMVVDAKSWQYKD